MNRPILFRVALSCFLLLPLIVPSGTASPNLVHAQGEGQLTRMPVRVVGERLVVRCELSTRFRRIPANLFIDYDRSCGLELHNRAADGLRVDANGGVPVTIHLPGAPMVVDKREHGDEEYLEEFTRLYSRELGEVACIGTIGSEVLSSFHVVFDLAAGLIELTPPREASTDATEEVEGTTRTSITLVNDLVWIPLRVADGSVLSASLGTSRFDTVVDRDICEAWDTPDGAIGSVKLKEVDLSRFVAWRPEEFVQVHPDGALGMTGLNFLEHFRVEIDRVNRVLRATETVPAKFPEADLAYFQALVEDEASALEEFLEEHPEARLAREAAERLLWFRLDEDAETAAFETALEWLDRTRIDDLRATEALTSMKMLLEARRPDVAIRVGEIGVKSGRKDRYPDSVHKLHSRLGELLLDDGQGQKAWEHLLSAAFGLPEDGLINLHLGRFYEQEKRYQRAMSRFIQAIIAPESGPQAVAGLERVQTKMGGDPLSVDLVDKLVAGKVQNFAAATKYEVTPETDTNRIVLAELFTNPHFGQRLPEGWRSFAVGGAMASEGLLSHFPREKLVVLSYHLDVPEPVALMNPLSNHVINGYGINRPVYFVINGIHQGPGAGRWRKAEEIYHANRDLVMTDLAEASAYEISGSAKLEAGTVSGSIEVRGPVAPDFVVQVVLAEKGVLYPGKAKVVVHRMVARGSLTGSLEGLPFKPRDGAMVVNFSRGLEEVVQDNINFLERYEGLGGANATRLSTKIDSRQITVVAFVRDPDSRAILQAFQIDPDGTGRDEAAGSR